MKASVYSIQSLILTYSGLLQAQPMFKDQKRYKDIVDPLLRRQYPEKSLNQAVAVAMMCLQDEPASRPLMTDVIVALNHLAVPSDGEIDISEQENPLIPDKYRSEEHIHDIEEDQRKTVADAIEWGCNSSREYMVEHERHSS